jgi:SAM-dependent methyltransferase
MTVSPDWWKDFFGGLVVDFWKGAIPDAATAADADFFTERLALTSGARVLDVPCGHGRFALELARRGCRVTGADLSSEFLALAAASAEEQRLSIEWCESDMRHMPWREEFDALVCAGNSFGYFDDAGNAAFLAGAARALRPGGRLLLEVGWVAEARFPDFTDGREIEAGGVRFTSRTIYDPVTARAESRYTLTRGTLAEERSASFRVYLARDILDLLRAQGFEDIQVYGSTRGEAFALGSPTLLALASRKSSRRRRSKACRS